MSNDRAILPASEAPYFIEWLQEVGFQRVETKSSYEKDRLVNSSKMEEVIVFNCGGDFALNTKGLILLNRWRKR